MKSVFVILVFRKRLIGLHRLKEKILEHFPQAQEQSDEKNKFLVFEQVCNKCLDRPQAAIMKVKLYYLQRL